jgi:hypothetical protein
MKRRDFSFIALSRSAIPHYTPEVVAPPTSTESASRILSSGYSLRRYSKSPGSCMYCLEQIKGRNKKQRAGCVKEQRKPNLHFDI